MGRGNFRVKTQHTGIPAGFTLFELLVVIAIIGIVSGIAVPVYKDYTQQGNATAAASTLSMLANQLEGHYLETRHYGNGQGQCGVTFSNSDYFYYSCSLQNNSDQQYRLVASSNEKFNPNNTLELSIDNQGSKSTRILSGSNVISEHTCWIFSITGACR